MSRKYFRRSILAPALGAMLLIQAASGMAQSVVGLTETGQPEVVALTGQAASVTGFRSALWGMTPAEVRATIARDFGGAKASALVADPLTGNQAMIAPMATLAPGPGPAAISYVFARQSGRLIHVNLDWTVKSPTPATRTALLDGGAHIVAGFAANFWKLGSVMRGVVVKPDLIILFAGADEAGGGVDVRLEGVPYTMGSGAALRSVAPPAGLASLHVGFSAPSAARGASNTLQPGAF